MQANGTTRGGEGAKTKNYFSGFSPLIFGLRGWGGVASSLRNTSSVFGSVTPSLRGFLSVAIGKSSQNQVISCDKPNSQRLSFSSQEDALNYARHVVEDSKRRFAAYNLIERYVQGDYYICVCECFRLGDRNNKIYDLIFSSIPDKLGNGCVDGTIDIIRPHFFDGDIGDNVHLGEFPVLVCNAHAVKREEKIVPSFVWLERTKKRYDVRRDILATPLDNSLQSGSILGKGEIGAFGVGDSRSESYSIGCVVKCGPEMFNGFGGDDGEIIAGERLSKSDFVQIIITTRVTLYDVGPLFCLEKSSLPFFKGKDVLLCARAMTSWINKT
jgi:hypothetical protein